MSVEASKAKTFFTKLDQIEGNTTERKDPNQSSPVSEYVPKGEDLVEPFTEENPPTDPPPVKPVQASGVTPESIKRNGVTGAHVAGNLLELLLSGVNTVNYLRKFDSTEKDRIIELQGMDPAKWTPADHNLNRRFLTITKKYEETKEKVKLTPDELNVLKEGFGEYHKATGKELSPSLIIWSTIGKVLIGRSIDILL